MLSLLLLSISFVQLVCSTNNYKLIRSYVSITAAKEKCLDTYGTDLASIHNTDDQRAVTDLCQNVTGSPAICWLGGYGGYLNKPTCDYVWDDGSSWDYTPYYYVHDDNITTEGCGDDQPRLCIAQNIYGLHDCSESHDGWPICNAPRTIDSRKDAIDCDLGTVAVDEDVLCLISIQEKDESPNGEGSTVTVRNSLNLIDSSGANSYCQNPRISVNYVDNDFDGANEYFDIFEGLTTEPNTLIQRCSSTDSRSCDRKICVTDKPLNNNNYTVGSSVNITIFVSGAVDGINFDGTDLCPPDNYQIDSEITFKCTRKTWPSPTTNPTPSPTTRSPTNMPTSNPTYYPTTASPTRSPTKVPTINPTRNPSSIPTLTPTNNPTISPSINPTRTPSSNPSFNPTSNPTLIPTAAPTRTPTFDASEPTKSPSINPTNTPTESPTFNTATPTTNPTTNPTTDPTTNPTTDPTIDPTIDPTTDPTTDPTIYPTVDPTNHPSTNPTYTPSLSPTDITRNPTTYPTTEPTIDPTSGPTIDPTNIPTKFPTNTPTIFPTEIRMNVAEENKDDGIILAELWWVWLLIVLIILIGIVIFVICRRSGDINNNSKIENEYILSDSDSRIDEEDEDQTSAEINKWIHDSIKNEDENKNKNKNSTVIIISDVDSDSRIDEEGEDQTLEELNKWIHDSMNNEGENKNKNKNKKNKRHFITQFSSAIIMSDVNYV